MALFNLATHGLFDDVTGREVTGMAQEVVKTFKELVDRLEAANTVGGNLEHILLIKGPTEKVITDESLPCVIYEMLDGGHTEDACFPRKVRYKLTALLTVMTLAADGYYNDAQTGIIDYLEKIMNTIDGSTAADLKGNGNWGAFAPQYRVNNLTRDGLKYTYYIQIELQSNRYVKGAL